MYKTRSTLKYKWQNDLDLVKLNLVAKEKASRDNVLFFLLKLSTCNS